MAKLFYEKWGRSKTSNYILSLTKTECANLICLLTNQLANVGGGGAFSTSAFFKDREDLPPKEIPIHISVEPDVVEKRNV